MRCLGRFFCGRIASAALCTGLATIGGLSAQNLETLGEYRLGVLGQSLDDPIYSAVYAGAFDAAEALAETYTLALEIIQLSPMERDAPGNADRFKAALGGQALDGLALSVPLPPPDWLNASLQALADANTLFCSFEQDGAGLDTVGRFTADETEAGRLAAERVRALMPRRGTIAILAGNSDEDPVLAARLAGAIGAMERQRYEVFHCAPNFTDALRTMETAHEADRNRRIRGWILLDNWALQGQAQLPWEPGQVATVAIQAGPTALPALRSGHLSGIVMHPIYEWGYASVVALIYQMHDRASEPPLPPSLAPAFYGREDLSRIEANWRDWQRPRSSR